MVSTLMNVPILNHPEQTFVIEEPIGWLKSLPSSVWIKVPGRDGSRCRVITTLLHGNEPSGFYAVHQWLLLGVEPACDLYILVASVSAAVAPPLFSHRMLPGKHDLNRCFQPPFVGEQGELAASIIDRLTELQPEAVVDIHNTSGSGPSFSVAVTDGAKQLILANLFCRRMIVTDIGLGSLMELDVGCPIVTIECGGAQDRESTAVAFQGISRYVEEEPLFNSAALELELLYHPMRLELVAGTTISYAASPVEDTDITIWSDIEQCNIGVTSVERSLGWIGVDGLASLKLVDGQGIDRVQELFRESYGQLYPKQPLKLFMATSRAEIAKQDCLFYVVSACDGR